MIDLHCHYLPGVDDGCRDMDESIQVIKMAMSEGVYRAVITPHMHPGAYDNSYASLLPVFEQLKSALVEHEVNIHLALAAEVRLTDEILFQLPAGKLPFIGKYEGNDVLLLELPYSHIPPGTEKMIRWMKAQGVTPMIAHPERIREVMKEPQRIESLEKAGALFQLTVGAFSGEFGDSVLETARWLLERDYATIVASDAHRINKRAPRVIPGLGRIVKFAGPLRMKELSSTVPASISRPLFINEHVANGELKRA